MSQTAVAIAALSISINVILVPLTLWFAAPGLKIRIIRWQMRSGRKDASLYVNKNNVMEMLISKRDGSKVKMRGGLHVNTPDPNFIYRLFGISFRLRRENDPEDIDIWQRENSTGLTAKEMDNVVNEAASEGLIQVLRQYFPVVVLLVAIIVLVALGSLYMQYVNFETLNNLAPDIAKILPRSLSVSP